MSQLPIHFFTEDISFTLKKGGPAQDVDKKYNYRGGVST